MEALLVRVETRLRELDRRRPWLAKRTGIPLSTINTWFSSDRIPGKIEQLIAVADALVFIPATFGEYAAPFFTADCPRVRRLRQEGKSIGATHIKKSRAYLEKHILPDPFSARPIAEITRGDLYQLRNRLEDKVGRINSLNKIMAVATTILSEAFEHQHIPHNPGARMGSVKYQRAERIALSPEAIKGILAECHPVIAVLAYTGMRASEVLAATWGQLADDVLRIDRAWKGLQEIGPPKWGKVREIPLPSPLLGLLADHKIESIRLSQEDLIFCYDDGSRYGPTWLKLRADKCLPKRATPHTLRHSLNTNLLAAGADPLKVQAYLGWSPNTRILTPVQAGYTHLRGHHLKDIADMISRLYG